MVRFGVVAVAEAERQRAEDYRGHTGWAEFVALIAAAETGPFGSDEAERLLAVAGTLLDQFDEEPTGEGYYPFKAVEQIELHCRMATGDVFDTAPVGLDEWIDRFAHHVDWQVAKSEVAGGETYHSRELERALSRLVLTRADDESFRAVTAASREAAGAYVSALRAALG